MKNKNLIPLIAGAAIGAGLLWLFNSEEGKEWLTKLKDKASQLKDDLADDLKDATDTFNDFKEKT